MKLSLLSLGCLAKMKERRARSSRSRSSPPQICWNGPLDYSSKSPFEQKGDRCPSYWTIGERERERYHTIFFSSSLSSIFSSYRLVLFRPVDQHCAIIWTDGLVFCKTFRHYITVGRFNWSRKFVRWSRWPFGRDRSSVIVQTGYWDVST